MASSAYDAQLDQAATVTPQALRFTYVAFLVRQGVRFGDLARVEGTVPAETLNALASLAPAAQRLPLDQVERLLPAVRALETGALAEIDQIRMAINGHHVMVDIMVEPVQEKAGGPRSLVVLFKDGPARDGISAEAGDVTMVRSEHVDRIEVELRATRERLQATIEELESTNEELKSSNEEYQSLNEELQSANEELETSREELQSVNEELTTVNGELAAALFEAQRQKGSFSRHEDAVRQRDESSAALAREARFRRHPGQPLQSARPWGDSYRLCRLCRLCRLNTVVHFLIDMSPQRA